MVRLHVSAVWMIYRNRILAIARVRISSVVIV